MNMKLMETSLGTKLLRATKITILWVVLPNNPRKESIMIRLD